jgi:hypothetical protein
MSESLSVISLDGCNGGEGTGIVFASEQDNSPQVDAIGSKHKLKARGRLVNDEHDPSAKVGLNGNGSSPRRAELMASDSAPVATHVGCFSWLAKGKARVQQADGSH